MIENTEKNRKKLANLIAESMDLWALRSFTTEKILETLEGEYPLPANDFYFRRQLETLGIKTQEELENWPRRG